MTYELITMGRVSVDVYPLQTGVGLEDVDTFGKYLGGSPTNVAVAAARFGRRAAVITRTGSDPFGRFVHRALREYGVDDRFVTAVPGLPTPLAFCEIFPPDRFPLYFYRCLKAPDLEIQARELDLPAIRGARVFWATGTGLCEEPSRTATLAALAARHEPERHEPERHGPEQDEPARHEPARHGPERPEPITVLDLDYRPMFWSSPAAAQAQVARALGYATVAVGNTEECAVAVGATDPYEAARRLRDRGVRLAVVKRGPKGVLALDGDGFVEVPPVPVEVVNGLGAGDAFGGALCHGLLAGWDTERILRFANAAGGIVASRLACSAAMPTAAEVDGVLAGIPARGDALGERTPAESPPAESPPAESTSNESTFGGDS